MTRKTIWIIFWTTMMLWLGQFWGCTAADIGQDQSYREVPGVPTLLLSLFGPNEDVAEQAIAGDVAQAADATSAAQSQPDKTPGNDQPSLSGMDRTGWINVTVGPADGRTQHHTIYHTDLAIGSRFDDGFDPSLGEQAIVEAMDGHSTQYLGDGNALAGFVQPLKFMWDTAWVPVHPFIRNRGLFGRHTTPPGEE